MTALPKIILKIFIMRNVTWSTLYAENIIFCGGGCNNDIDQYDVSSYEINRQLQPYCPKSVIYCIHHSEKGENEVILFII